MVLAAHLPSETPLTRSRPSFAVLAAVIPASFVAVIGIAGQAQAYPVGGPTITGSSGSAPICTNVTFTVAGWRASSDVRIYFLDAAPAAPNADGVPSNANLAATETTNASGSANDTFDFSSTGEYTVYAAGTTPAGNHAVESTLLNATDNSGCDPGVTPHNPGSPMPTPTGGSGGTGGSTGGGSGGSTGTGGGTTAGGGSGAGTGSTAGAGAGSAAGAGAGAGSTTVVARTTSGALLGLLPFTGTNSIIALLMWGLAAVLLGFGLVVLARRQRERRALPIA